MPGAVGLAAALQAIRGIGDAQALDEAAGRAFPGSRVEVTAPGGRFELALRQPGLLRPLRAAGAARAERGADEPAPPA